MSDEAVIALAALVVSGIVGLATLGFNFWNASSERKQRLRLLRLEQEEKYRADLYEKRLEVHQQAFKWLMDLPYPLRDALKPEVGAEETEVLSGLYRDARSWWDGNCLYLDEQSRNKTIACIEKAGMVAEDGVKLNWFDEAKEFMEARRVVQEGISMKHLDVQEPKRSVG